MLKDKIQQRAAFMAAIRAFFARRDVLEVDTNLLRACGVTDVNLVSLPAAQGYLITSPEYAMKTLLASGSGDIYQLSHVFRGEECGTKHLQEFTLLEWYRLGFDHQRLMQEVATFIRELLQKPALKVVTTPYAELFANAFQLDIFTASEATIKALAVAKIPESSAWEMPRDGWLDLLFTHFIEPNLGSDGLEFVCEYPPSQAALSRVITDSAGHNVAARFEAYIKGIELCNGFWELIDAQEQRARFLADNAERRALGLPEMPIDEAFLVALEKGVPPCAGVALGVDRLLMLATGASAIQDVVLD